MKKLRKWAQILKFFYRIPSDMSESNINQSPTNELVIEAMQLSHRVSVSVLVVCQSSLCTRFKTAEWMHTHYTPFIFFLFLLNSPLVSLIIQILATVVTRLFLSEWLFSQDTVFLRTYQTNKFSWASILIFACVTSVIANWKLLASGNSKKTANDVNLKQKRLVTEASCCVEVGTELGS